MGTFAGLQGRAKALCDARGLGVITWRWDHDGWSATAPNEGRRWWCAAGSFLGQGATGEEAFRELIAALEETPWP